MFDATPMIISGRREVAVSAVSIPYPLAAPLSLATRQMAPRFGMNPKLSPISTWISTAVVAVHR